MLRAFVAASAVLLLCAGAGLGQDEKGKGKGKGKGMRLVGTVKKFDASSGTLTIQVRSKQDKAAKEQEVKITDSTKVTIFGNSADDKREATGKDGLKNVKDGTRIAVIQTEGKAAEVIVNPMSRKKADK
jgi:hypothetical protein